MSKTRQESESALVNGLAGNLKILTISKHQKIKKIPHFRPRKTQSITKRRLEPIWEVFEPEESERETESDDTKENITCQVINNDSDDEDIEITGKCLDDLIFACNYPTEILLEADKEGLSQHQAIAYLQRLKQRIISSPSHDLKETFCHQMTDFGVTFTALEYAAYKNKREVAAFLVNVITNECFPSVMDAGHYFASLQLLHGMVMSRQRLSSTLDLLLSVTVVHNGKDRLLFSPWARNEDGKTMLDLLKENTVMDEGSRRFLESELEGRIEALRGAQISGICDAEFVPQHEVIAHNDDIPLLPQLENGVPLGEMHNGGQSGAGDVNGDLVFGAGIWACPQERCNEISSNRDDIVIHINEAHEQFGQIEVPLFIDARELSCVDTWLNISDL